MTRVWQTTRVLTMLVVGGGVLGMLGTMAGAQQTGAPQAGQPAPAKPTKAAPAKAKPKPAAAGEEAGEKAAFDPEAALDKASKAFAEGKAPVAIGLADQVLGHSAKTPRTTARALAIRGQARLRQGKSAEAISDLDNALWVKDGLGTAERDAATAARGEAYRQAGLGAAPVAAGQPVLPRTGAASTQAAPVPAPAAVAQFATEPPRAATPRLRPVAAEAPAPVASAAPAPAQPNSGGSFFSNLFGLSSGTPATPNTTSAIPAAPKSPTVSASEPQRATVPARDTAPPKVAAAAVAPASAAVVRTIQPTGEGSQIQLAAVRTREAALEMATKVRKENAATIGSRTYEIDEPVFGNMGKFYRVRIGPFASPTESLGVCSALRNQGVDCMVVGQ